jgi:predicted small integral membrane protein
MKLTRNDFLFYLSLIFAIWFASTGMVWTYNAALFIAYPVGIISLVMWTIIRNENRKRTKFIPIILTIGLTLSLSVLVCLLIWD